MIFNNILNLLRLVHATMPYVVCLEMTICYNAWRFKT